MDVTFVAKDPFGKGCRLNAGDYEVLADRDAVWEDGEVVFRDKLLHVPNVGLLLISRERSFEQEALGWPEPAFWADGLDFPDEQSPAVSTPPLALQRMFTPL